MSKYTKNIKDILVGIVGFILSPVSFWNDLFVNIPIAYVLAIPFFGIFNDKFFIPSVIFWYIVTNVVGILMMHFSVINIKNEVANGQNNNLRKDISNSILLGILYSAIVLILFSIGFIEVPTEFLDNLR